VLVTENSGGSAGSAVISGRLRRDAPGQFGLDDIQNRAVLMASGQIFSVLAGHTGTAGQVSDFKVEQVSFIDGFHGGFSLGFHRGSLYQKSVPAVNMAGPVLSGP
jgi:hypothetical protein